MATIIIPENFSKLQLSSIMGNVFGSTIGLFITIFAMLWRGQISELAKSSLSPTEIQQLPSQRFIAGCLLTNSPPVQHLYASFAISKSAFIDYKEYSSLKTTEEREDFLKFLIDQLINSKGPIGVPQGGPISPCIANMTLNDLEAIIIEVAKSLYKKIEKKPRTKLSPMG